MIYSEKAPSEELNDLVLNYWIFEIPESAANGKPFIHETMPENTMSIVFINQPYFKGIRILGPQIKRFQQQVHPGSTYLGIRFNPWVKMNDIVVDKKSIINKTVDIPLFLNDVFKEIEVNSLKQNYSDYHLLEICLQRLIENGNVIVDPLAKYICLQLMEEAKINELIKNIPLSIRPIQNNFKSITGITMSNYRSIHRIQNTIKMVYLEKGTIVDAAFKNNYTDHSHFINTFKKFMNTSVKNFLLKTEKIEISL